MTLDSIFGTTQHIDAWQECARAVLFVYGWVLVRLAGRRAFARWSALDIVVAIVSGANLSRTITGNADLFGTLAATTLLMGLHWLLARAAAASPRLSRLLEGRSVRLMVDGSLRRKALLRHGISAAALEEALHRSGVRDLRDVEALQLEPNGNISVEKRST